ncbi:MAG: ADP-ribosylation factor-like protein [Promethearchaeota archaeon]
METNDNSEIQEITKKILVMGLSNSGKTSIILNMLAKDNLLDYISLNPTEGVKVRNLKKGSSFFSLWELGGEDVYIKEYLEDFEKYIIDTEEIFFVIDIQDVDKYDKALNYLKKIIDIIKSRKNVVEITIFLHKNDHDIFKKFPDINETKIDNLINRIKTIIPPNFFHEIYKTTIYTLLDKVHVY